MRNDKIPMPSMRGIYFIRNKYINGLFRFIDAFLRLLILFRTRKRPKTLKRILIANGAHLGDVVISTAVLPFLRRELPDAQFGMLIGSWSLPVVNKHELIEWVHTVDHWRLNRLKRSLLIKILLYYKTRSRALREIKDIGYDACVDLYFYFPNSIVFLWQSGIPQRLGYTSAGFGPLLTAPFDLPKPDDAMVNYHGFLIRHLLGLDTSVQDHLQPILPHSTVDTKKYIGRDDYIVVHMGAGASIRYWRPEAWQELVKRLLAARQTVVVTGQGASDRAQIDLVISADLPVVDLCDKLTWDEFVETIRNARLLVTVDSSAAHVASAVDTPVVVIGHGLNGQSMWHPTGSKSTVIRNKVECLPCHRKNGCMTMDCIRGVEVNEVLLKVNEYLAGHP